MNYLQRTFGFTLIELLVVIAIIGLLATTVLAALSNSRSQSRDTQRLVQARELMKALEVYRVKHGSYPCSGTSLVCVAGAEEYSLRAYLSRPSSGTYEADLPAIETTFRSQIYAPEDDPFGYSLMYRVRKSGGTAQADSSSYTILVGLENPISSATASTTFVTVDGNIDAAGDYSMHYCKITAGTPDTLSVIGVTGSSTNLALIGLCPVSGLK